MTCKKTWLSCLLWAAFSCVTAALLAGYIISFWKSEINAAPGMDAAYAVFGVFALLAGCYLIIRVIVRKIGEKCKVSARTIFLWELFIVLCIFAAGLLYRFHLLLQGALETVDMTSFYQHAMLKEGESVTYMEHGMSYLYTLCLSFVLSFLGNKVIAGILLQVLLQMLTMLFGFLAVRKTAGKIPACAALLMLALSPAYAEQIFVMTPEIMYLFLYVLGMFIVGSYVKNYCEAWFNIPMAVTSAVICGIIVGVFTYLDAFSLTLLIFMACLFTGVRTTIEDRRFGSALFSGLMFLLVIAAGGLALTGGFALDAYINGDTLAEMAEVWISPYRNEMNYYSLMNYGFFIAEGFSVERFVTVLLAAFLIPAFWNRKKIQNVSPWFVLMLLLNSPITSTGVLEYNVCNMFVWSVLAGAGVQLSFVLEKKDAEEAESMAATASAESSMTMATAAPAAAETSTTSTTSTTENTESLVATVAAIAAAAEAASDAAPNEAPASTMVPVAEPGQQPALVSEPTPAPAPRFLENPLPLPKKHEKKAMDYQYEVPADKMKFDIEIDENDDFDY